MLEPLPDDLGPVSAVRPEHATQRMQTIPGPPHPDGHVADDGDVAIVSLAFSDDRGFVPGTAIAGLPSPVGWVAGWRFGGLPPQLTGKRVGDIVTSRERIPPSWSRTRGGGDATLHARVASLHVAADGPPETTPDLENAIRRDAIRAVLARRVQATVPDPHVDAALHRWWASTEGAVLDGLDAEDAALEASWAAWRAMPSRRASARAMCVTEAVEQRATPEHWARWESAVTWR